MNRGLAIFQKQRGTSDVLHLAGGSDDLARFMTVGQGNVPRENWYSATHHRGVELPDWAASISPALARQLGITIDPYGYDPNSWFMDPQGRWNYAGDASSGGGRRAIEFRWPGGSPGLEGTRGRITPLRNYRGGGGFNPAAGGGYWASRAGVAPASRIGIGGKQYRDISEPSRVGMGVGYFETPNSQFPTATPAPWQSYGMPGWFRPGLAGGSAPAPVGPGRVIVGGGGGFAPGVYTGELGGPDDPGRGGEGGAPIGGGPFSGWTPQAFDYWHSGPGLSQMGYADFTGRTAGPGGAQLPFETTSYQDPQYGWVPRAQLANAQASNNPLDYFNPFGGTSRGGAGTGGPTQRGVGMVAGTAANLLLPGSGFLIGPLARYVTSLFQKQHPNATPQEVQAAVAKQLKLPPMPSGSVSLPTGGGYAPSAPGPTGQAPIGREWWSSDFGRGLGPGAGGYNLAGPGGGFGQRGTGFGSGTVGNFATAIGFGGNLGGGGPVGAQRFRGGAGLYQPFSQQQYEQGIGGYAAPSLWGGMGGPTQGPSYQQYLSMWNPTMTQPTAQQSKHIAQRQEQQEGTADVSNTGLKFYQKKLLRPQRAQKPNNKPK